MLGAASPSARASSDPGGAMVAYVTLATERLEPREARRGCGTGAIVADSFTAAGIEAAAADAGLVHVESSGSARSGASG